MSDEKYIGAIAAAKNAALTKAALEKKLDKTGGTITGSLKVDGIMSVGMSLDLKSGIDAGGCIHSEESLLAPALGLYNGAKETSVSIDCSGDNAAKITSLSSDGKSHYARLAVATPTDDNDATTKAYVDGKVAGLQTADQVQTAINSAISGVYTPKGSIAFKSLPTAAAGNKGWVYNVTDAFTTTAAFVEGAGHAYGAGTNVVCVDVGGGSYKWDVLAGMIDLTELTADEVQTLWDSI